MRKKKPATTNEETSQSLARVIICGFGGAVLLFKALQQHELPVDFLVVAIYFTLSVPWFIWVKRTPNRFPNRRYLTVSLDLLLTTLALHLAGSRAPFFYPVYLWVIVGNGLRFGARFLFLAMVLGFLGFGALLKFNPFWQANQNIGLGLLMGVVILPLFYLKVLRRTHDLNLRLEEELEKSQAAEKAKGDFLANMSHEIRTPMNGVIGMAEVLADTDLDAKQQAHLEVIVRSADSLLNILNDILDYSKIASGKMQIESITMDLRETLLDVTRLLKSTAEDKGITLIFDFPEDQPRTFISDPTRIRQIVFNLVGNGLKFTEQGSVTLRCRTTDNSSRHNVTLEIEDTGIGIPEDRLEAIFEQFEQADQGTTRKFGGTGLGLAISRQLAFLMGGEILVRSTMGVGTTFSINLTLPYTPEKIPTRNQSTELPDFGLRALVAEDNKVNQLVVRKLLAKVGVEVVDMANNGLEALEMLSIEKHDLVFMDVRMPVMNGLEATKAIRALPDDRNAVPIVALTADASSEDAQRCLLFGMDAHLRKPLKVDELVLTLNQLDLAEEFRPALS